MIHTARTSRVGGVVLYLEQFLAERQVVGEALATLSRDFSLMLISLRGQAVVIGVFLGVDDGVSVLISGGTFESLLIQHECDGFGDSSLVER